MSQTVKKQLENKKDAALQQLFVDFSNLPSQDLKKEDEHSPSGRSLYKLGEELGK